MSELIKAKTVKNIIKVALSNAMTLIAGVLVGFILPKIIGITDYGYYKTFTLYCSYVGLVHIGITDGIYLKYGGKKYEEIEGEKEVFRLYNFIVFFLDIFFSFTLCVTAIFAPNDNIRFILFALSAYLILNNVVGHFQIISQITNRFNELAIKNTIHSVLIIMSVLLLWVFNRFFNYGFSFKFYIIVYVSIIATSAIYYIIRYRNIIFGKKASFIKCKGDVLLLVRIGIPLLVANLCTGLILNIDRQIVNIFWPVSDSNEYSIYAFAYNLLSLITIAISAISTVIYPTLKKAEEETLRKNYSNLLTLILSFGFFCLTLFYPLSAFISWFLPKYVDSLTIFRIIFPGIVLSSAISIVIHNYYKVVGKSSLFFIYSLIVLALSLISDLIVYFVFRSTVAISVASIFCILFWYSITDLYFEKKYSINCFKNYSLILVLTILFYLITMIENAFIGFVVHFLTTLLITYIYNIKTVNRFVKSRIIKNNNTRKMTFLVSGVAGQLGHDVVNELSKRGIAAICSDILSEDKIINKALWDRYIQLDIIDKEAVDKVINELKPDAIIHCAAWTNVDGAEDSNNKPLVKKINVDGTDNLVKAAKKVGAKFMYISTDYVFNGEGKEPWKPDDKDYAPLNYYGQTKLEGELSVSSQLDKYFIVRIAWVFGLNGKNFIKTMLSLADKGYKELGVVNDQIGTPTYTYDLARLLVDIILTDKYGYYHATNEGGYISWADFAEEIFRQANKDVKVNRVTTEEYGVSIAKRPHNSRLDKTKLVKNGFKPLPDWKDAVKRYLEEIREK